MRQRVVLIFTVMVFAGAVIGASLVASDGGGRRLQRLPLLPLDSAGSSASSASDGAAALPAVGMSPGAFGVEYQVEGTLPKLPDHAQAYTLGMEGGQQRVERLVAALGLNGRAQLNGREWRLQDGTRVLSVDDLPGLPWRLFDMGPCAVTSSAVPPSVAGGGGPGFIAGCAVAEGGVASGTATAIAPNDCSSGCTTPPTPRGPPVVTPPPPPRPADLPSRDEAQRVATDLLSRAGGPSLTGATVRVVDAFSSWLVQFDPSIVGVEAVGVQESALLGPSGPVTSANGCLATRQPSGGYPLAGLDKGLDRLRHGVGIGPVPLGAASAGSGTAVLSGPPPQRGPGPLPPVPAVGTGSTAQVAGTSGVAVACPLPKLAPDPSNSPAVAAPPPPANAPSPLPPCGSCAAVEGAGGGTPAGGPAVRAPARLPRPAACPVPSPSASPAPVAPAQAGPPPAPGPPIPAVYPWCGRPIVQTITGAHVALEMVPSFTTSGGAQANLEPAYVFELKGGGTTFPVPAVVDADLQQVVPPPPGPKPLPAGRPSPGQPTPAPTTEPAQPSTTTNP